MPTAADFFPSKFLRAADLKGDVVATVDTVTVDVFENDGRKQQKPVISFKENGLKPMVCNKTNFALIAGLCGNDTDQWIGKKIGLHKELVAFKGAVTESIRVKQPSQEFNDSIDF